MSRMVKVKMKPPPEDLVEVFEEEGDDGIPQGSPEWFAVRIGIPTASVFSTIRADGRDGGESEGRKKLLYQMAGEILTGEPAETYENDAMRRGRLVEADALADYAFTRQVEVRRVGFVRRTIRDPLAPEALVVGASPDGLVGDEGGIQVKSLRPDLLVQIIDSGRFPSEHRWQVQGEMWVTGRKWWDLKLWCRTPLMTTAFPVSPTWRIERDDAVIAEIRRAVEIFAHDLRKLVERVRARGGGR